MEFSYRISEAEYRAAARLAGHGPSGARTRRIAMFWAFIFLCLMLLWTVVNKTNGSKDVHPVSHETAASSSESSQSATLDTHKSVVLPLLVNIVPFVLIAAAWFFLLVRLGPSRLRKLYRRDPAMQGQVTANIAPDSLSMRNTIGTTAQSGWNIYEYWREGKSLIVLRQYSGVFLPINLSGLSESERGELRMILTAALPKK